MDGVLQLLNASNEPVPAVADSNGVLRVRPLAGDIFEESSIISAGVKTTTQNGSWIANLKYSELIAYLDITAVPTTDTITLSIEMRPISNNGTITLLAGDAEVATGAFLYGVGLGMVIGNGGLDKVVGTHLPAEFRFVVTHSSSGDFNYTLDAFYRNAAWRYV